MIAVCQHIPIQTNAYRTRCHWRVEEPTTAAPTGGRNAAAAHTQTPPMDITTRHRQDESTRSEQHERSDPPLTIHHIIDGTADTRPLITREEGRRAQHSGKGEERRCGFEPDGLLSDQQQRRCGPPSRPACAGRTGPQGSGNRESHWCGTAPTTERRPARTRLWRLCGRDWCRDGS